MQPIPFSPLSGLIIAQTFLMQIFWHYLGRYARDIYLGDIMNFRTPKSTMSRYYDWRVRRFANAVTEAVVYLVVLLVSFILISFAFYDITALTSETFYVVFMLFLSLISSMQIAWRVREINDFENGILSSISTATDKIGLARQMVEDLLDQGQMADGRVWFALFRLAQRSNRVGWAIRDVLIEKSKEMKELQRQSREVKPSAGGKGPGIES